MTLEESKRFGNYFHGGRREGYFMAVDVFCSRNHLEFIKPMLRYTLFGWFFKWYCKSKIGEIINRTK